LVTPTNLNLNSIHKKKLENTQLSSHQLHQNNSKFTLILNFTMNILSILTCFAAFIVASAQTNTPAAAASTSNKKYKFTYSWKTESTLLVPRSDASATPTQTSIIIAGGCIGKQSYQDWGGYGCDTITDKVSVFNPLDGKCTATASMPRARYRHTAVNVANKIYLLGGTNLDYPEPVLAEIDVFDIKISKWSTLPTNLNLPFATTDPASFVIDSKIYFTGGYETTNYTAFSKTWCLDVNNIDAGWKSVAAAPTERGDAVGVTINGAGYVFGGFTHYNEFSEPVGTLESYSPVDNKWTTLKAMPTARGDKAGAVLHDRFHVIGGETKDKKGNSVPISDVEVYDPVEKTWQDEGKIPSERFRFMAAALDNVIYIFGGQKFLIGTPGASDSYYPVSDQIEAFVEKRIGISEVDSGSSPCHPHVVPLIGFLLIIVTGLAW
jgi:hypothetical protein